jgi:hypothetical protein
LFYDEKNAEHQILNIQHRMAWNSKMTLILQETEELIKIFAASVRTAEKNAK